MILNIIYSVNKGPKQTMTFNLTKSSLFLTKLLNIKRWRKEHQQPTTWGKIRQRAGIPKKLKSEDVHFVGPRRYAKLNSPNNPEDILEYCDLIFEINLKV